MMSSGIGDSRVLDHTCGNINIKTIKSRETNYLLRVEQ